MGFNPSTLGRDLPWKTKLRLSYISLASYIVLRRNGTVNRRLLSLLEQTTKPNPNPVHGVRTTDFTVDQARGLWCRLFLPVVPAKPASLPLLVFFHGGGFATLSAATREYDAACRRFCTKLGVAVVSVNYRLSPEHRFPAQYDDGVDVLRFMESNQASDFPGKEDPLMREFLVAVDLSTCFLAGDSAGANIVHNVARRWTAEDNHHVRLAGLISIQPFFGGETRVDSETRLHNAPIITVERADWLWKAFLPDGATRDHPAASPFTAAEDLGERFPPVMVMVGELDPLQDWQRAYFQSLKKNGKEAEIIEYRGAFHSFYLFPELKSSLALTEDVGSFILRQTNPPIRKEV